MANEKEISWLYIENRTPCLGIRLKTESGVEYPLTLNDETLVMIDTGYDGEIKLPRDIYYMLGFNKWEEPEPDTFEVADGSTIEMNAAKGFILIPKLRPDPYTVKVHSVSDENIDTPEILIGATFIKRFRLLLDGPATKVCVL